MARGRETPSLPEDSTFGQGNSQTQSQSYMTTYSQTLTTTYHPMPADWATFPYTSHDVPFNGELQPPFDLSLDSTQQFYPQAWDSNCLYDPTMGGFLGQLDHNNSSNNKTPDGDSIDFSLHHMWPGGDGDGGTTIPDPMLAFSPVTLTPGSSVFSNYPPWGGSETSPTMQAHPGGGDVPSPQSSKHTQSTSPNSAPTTTTINAAPDMMEQPRRKRTKSSVGRHAPAEAVASPKHGRRESKTGRRDSTYQQHQPIPASPYATATPPPPMTTPTITTPPPTPTEQSPQRAHPAQQQQPTTSSSSDPAEPTHPHEQQQQPRRRQGSRDRNRAAATKCRAKAKAAVSGLEAAEKAQLARHTRLAATVAGLRDEVRALKNELLRHGGCDCEPIQAYLASAALSIGRGEKARAAAALL